MNLLRLQTPTGTNIYTVFVSKAGELMFRNDVRATVVWSPTKVGKDAWHQVQIRVKVGASGQIEVWYDGQPVGALSINQNLGTAMIGRLSWETMSRAGRTESCSTILRGPDARCLNASPDQPPCLAAGGTIFGGPATTLCQQRVHESVRIYGSTQRAGSTEAASEGHRVGHCSIERGEQSVAGFRQNDVSLSGHAPGEGHLVVIHVFPEPMSPRDHDGDDAQTATHHDASGPRVAHHDIGRPELGDETIVRRGTTRTRRYAGRSTYRTGQATDLSRSPGQPMSIHPTSRDRGYRSVPS